MTHYSSCPLCGNDLLHERTESGHMICECGWTANDKEKDPSRLAARQIMKLTLGLAAVLIPATVYLAQWNGFGLDVLGLRTISAIGIASNAQKHSLAELYVRLSKNDLAIAAYKNLISQNPQDLDAYEKLIHLESEAKLYPDAVKTFLAYFQVAKGIDSNVRFRFAQTLALAGQFDEARVEYDKILVGEPDVLQITVAKAYVTMLLEQNKYQEAKTVIQQFQSHGSNGKDYLNEELQMVETKLRGSKT